MTMSIPSHISAICSNIAQRTVDKLPNLAHDFSFVVQKWYISPDTMLWCTPQALHFTTHLFSPHIFPEKLGAMN